MNATAASRCMVLIVREGRGGMEMVLGLGCSIVGKKDDAAKAHMQMSARRRMVVFVVICGNNSAGGKSLCLSWRCWAAARMELKKHAT